MQPPTLKEFNSYLGKGVAWTTCGMIIEYEIE